VFSSLKPIESDRISRLISDKVARIVIVTVTYARILDIREGRGHDTSLKNNIEIWLTDKYHHNKSFSYQKQTLDQL
jgi:hypothetical protein